MMRAILPLLLGAALAQAQAQAADASPLSSIVTITGTPLVMAASAVTRPSTQQEYWHPLAWERNSGSWAPRAEAGLFLTAGADHDHPSIAIAPTGGTASLVAWRMQYSDARTSGATYRPIDASGINLEQAWARPTAGLGRTGAVYLTIIDAGTADRLISISTPVAAMASMHETIDDQGVMKMREVDGVSLVPGAPVVFKPGGLHIMLMGLKAPLKLGDTFPLTLTFAHAPPQTVTVSVQSRPGAVPAEKDGHTGGMHDTPHK